MVQDTLDRRATRAPLGASHQHALLRQVTIGLISFFTLVDLFATQAILPSLVLHYGVSPADMGFAVNASTMGMAGAGLGVALISRHIDRRKGVWISLLFLAIPTWLLADAPDLATFTALRVLQGIFMSSAFALMIAYIAERCSGADAASALAAYVTGNVLSNLVGRLLSAAAVGHVGIAGNFQFFALLNLAGAFLAYLSLQRTVPMAATGSMAPSVLKVWKGHITNPPLLVTFFIGFLILFAFIGTFTYVNFVLASAPIALGAMELGFVYFVFLPSVLTTPFAGRFVRCFGTRPTFWASLGLAILGLPLLIQPYLEVVLFGLTLVGVGTFFAQATATGFVGRTAVGDRASASGLYLASYFFGGLVGSALLGQIFVRLGWTATVIGIGAALLLAAALATALRTNRLR